MDGSSYFPSRPEMQANLEAFAERAGIAVRYDCEWQSTATRGRPGRHDLRARDLRRRVPDAEPRARRGRGASRGARRRQASSSRATTPTRATPRRTPASGSSSSASRTPGSSSPPGSPPWASSITVCSPSPAKTSIETRSLAGVRARYVQPFEDNFLGLGVKILDASIAAIVKDGDALRVDLKRTDTGEDLTRRGRRGDRRDRLHLPAARPARARRDDVRPGQAAGGDAAVGERQRARDLVRRARSARRRPACASTASRPTRAPSTGTATTGGSSPATSRRRASASTIERPLRRPGRHRPVPPARGDPGPGAVAQQGVPRRG